MFSYLKTANSGSENNKSGSGKSGGKTKLAEDRVDDDDDDYEEATELREAVGYLCKSVVGLDLLIRDKVGFDSSGSYSKSVNPNPEHSDNGNSASWSDDNDDNLEEDDNADGEDDDADNN